jgi:hypothetical protein
VRIHCVVLTTGFSVVGPSVYLVMHGRTSAPDGSELPAELTRTLSPKAKTTKQDSSMMFCLEGKI